MFFFNFDVFPWAHGKTCYWRKRKNQYAPSCYPKKKKKSLGVVAHACNPTYSGGVGRKIKAQGAPREKA
jgi:hypothetical protein